MYDACHINGTWESKEVGRLNLLYECDKLQSRGPSLVGGVDPLDTMIFYFTLLMVVQGKKLK